MNSQCLSKGKKNRMSAAEDRWAQGNPTFAI